MRFSATNSVINRLEFCILKVLEKVNFDDSFCELGELFFMNALIPEPSEILCKYQCFDNLFSRLK